MLREGFSETDLRLFDHVTRAVRKDDLIAFKLLTDKTKYYELPDDLRRYDAAAFTDKYNRSALQGDHRPHGKRWLLVHSSRTASLSLD
jgi:DNA (cytosine-5)-methyltransferase 1